MGPIFRVKGWSGIQSLVALLFILAFACEPVAARGVVVNRTPWTMRITRNPNSSSATHWCQFWNWWTLTSPIPRSARVRCTQENLPPGKTSTGDVDGFTFHDREYYSNSRATIRGVWTKITDLDTATCVNSGGTPRCNY
ncbi:hypothetical protein QBC40DRAFT_259942 [Triangularia verruculosa]|uniref:Secreted protein n=1 Tax=Triangularia verruculosa TaxID=2587418 RepID=A0AAN6X5Z5_9PEZI|nr:hypothetical protein QBC40DRAFT_259942 [Triangularia verruculosa]